MNAVCGIAGFLKRGAGQPQAAMCAQVVRMADAIRHRGPDDSGAWVDASAGIALSHRRLSIIDLSPLGHQPMESADGNWIIVFNGEIYNFQELRDELEGRGHAFWGHSDTEVMLAAFTEWGVEKSLRRFNGMFAFAVWNRAERTLYFARDRLGKKPLYYGWAGDTLLFGSELKALQAHAAFRAEIDRGALALFLRHNYIPSPHSIYRGIFKLPPAAMVAVPPSATGVTPAPVSYWSAREVAEQGAGRRIAGVEEALEELGALLKSAVGLRMIADVPLGAFLSGGIDSSLVVSLMQASSARPVKTFSIGFHEQTHDEARHAKAVARHLGTEHTELYVTPRDAMDVIPRLPSMFDEPFADSSQIPTFLVSQLARTEVTVSLSGDGGDELFAGYSAYHANAKFWTRYGAMPRVVRQVLSLGARGLSPSSWDHVMARLNSWAPEGWRRDSPGIRLHRLANVLSQPTEETVYRSLISYWQPPFSLVPEDLEPPTAFTDPARRARLGSFTERMMYLDTVSYLPDDILVKVDRASMAVSLEARCPLLDHRVAEFAWRVPLEMKVRDGKGKWLIRQLLYRYVPEAMVERPKTGFEVPLGDWLRGPLRGWAERLIAPERLRSEGILNPEPLRPFWTQHINGVYDWGRRLWPVLMFQAWLEAQ
ncbi:MAG: asparagine synthase (glutamine-hydrolyzing) [Bryobacteraceae bacterium]|nr:asparagine synthase (glutamine-hydrolyzing) [Bryobacteraceae bacterium]